jgi:hypothetical protein
VREVRALKDEEHLYLRLLLDKGEAWRKHPITIGLDMRQGGNKGLPGLPGVDPGAEVAITIGPGDHARLRWASWVDPIPFMYGLNHHYVPYRESDLHPGSGTWVEPRLILNKPYTVPSTKVKRPTEIVGIGDLPWGTGDPQDEAFDNRNLVDGHGNVLELRLPYSMITFSDPSQLALMQPHRDGTVGFVRTKRVQIAVATEGELLKTTGYAWERWQGVTWHERRKRGWDVIADAMRSTAKAGVRRDAG